jgi:hypothetical protein
LSVGEIIKKIGNLPLYSLNNLVRSKSQGLATLVGRVKLGAVDECARIIAGKQDYRE